MKTKKTTKTKEVLNHLKSGKSITSLEAINLYGATRLSAIIHTLRGRGHDIVSVSEQKLDRNGNVCRFSRYTLCTTIEHPTKPKSNRINKTPSDKIKNLNVNNPKVVDFKSYKKEQKQKPNKSKGFFARLFNL